MAQPQPQPGAPPAGILQPQDLTQPSQPANQSIPRSPYPAPPPFWKHFTSTNLARLKEAVSQEPLDPTELPYELLVLHPPPPPTSPDQQYTTFNIPHYVVPRPTLPATTPDQPEGILLFSPDDLTRPARQSTSATARPHAKLLSRLTKSLLLNFLELTTIMAENPQYYWAEKINDIAVLTENIAAVINLLRPHQARESVKTMLEERLVAGREEMQRADEVRSKVEDFLREVEDNGKLRSEDEEGDVDVDGDGDGPNGYDINRSTGNRIGVYVAGGKEKQAQIEIEKARKLWAMLDDLDGD